MKKDIKRDIRGALSRLMLATVLLPSFAYADSTTFQGPAKYTDIQSFIAGVLKAVVQISLPILTLFIVYAGFLFVTARGNAERLNKAKMNFLYVIIGAILILGAWVLATLIASTANQVLGS